MAKGAQRGKAVRSEEISCNKATRGSRREEYPNGVPAAQEELRQWALEMIWRSPRPRASVIKRLSKSRRNQAV